MKQIKIIQDQIDMYHNYRNILMYSKMNHSLIEYQYLEKDECFSNEIIHLMIKIFHDDDVLIELQLRIIYMVLSIV